MNTLFIQVPIKPLSVNAKFTINKYKRRIVKSNVANKFEKTVEGYLNQCMKEIDQFTAAFNPKKYGLTMDILMYIPEDQFFTKKGAISSTCIDAGNAMKMLEDIIYKRMGLNDGLNLKVSSEKRPYTGEDWLTLVTISEVLIPKSCYLDAIALTLCPLASE